MSDALSGNGPCTDTHTNALDLLRDALGATVIATCPNARAPLPATGPCSRCGATTTRYGPHGSPLCADCRPPGHAVPLPSPDPVTLMPHQVSPCLAGACEPA
jgi:hypothetical protein